MTGRISLQWSARMPFPAPEPVPVTVLTGYLGAGKTTLLNRILGERHGRRYAVIINEFGELGVDNELVVDADEEVFETNNGCICCTVRGDLIRIIGGLMKRRGRFDGIVVETTGLADPAPIAQTFFADEGVRAAARLDSVVCVVDAANMERQLAESAEAAGQIAFADAIVLNKTDLVDAAALARVEAEIRRRNPFATVHAGSRGAVPIPELLGRGSFDLARVLAGHPDFLEEEVTHAHDDDITSVSLQASEPLDLDRFNKWIGDLLAEKGQDLLRTKGILAFAGESRRFAFQAVHMMAEGDFLGPWKDGESPSSRVVFIGRNLNRPALRRGFEACRAG